MRPRIILFSVVLVMLFFLFLAQPVLSQAPTGQVQGIWQATYSTPWGTANEQLVLMHTGTFSRTVVSGWMRVYTTGEYRVGPGFIRYFNDYNSRLPNMPRTETHFFQFLDANHIRFEDRVMGTQWVATRVGP